MSAWLRTAALGVLVLAAPGRAADQAAIDKAIDKGVAALRKMQQQDGTWPHAELGATALAGLTLLECKVPADDKAVVAAADAVRKASVGMTHTYTIVLSILFLDRLGDPGDIPLIESLTVRLMAGQLPGGTWNYSCPGVAESEVRRLTTVLRQRNELKGRRDLPGVGKKRRTVRDLPREIQAQLSLLNRRGGPVGPQAARMVHNSGDHSNTQFGALGLWVARRHGLPVDAALARTAAHFRLCQDADGGWAYMANVGIMAVGPGRQATPSMTCAGLMCVALEHGVRRVPDPGKDPALRKGLELLSTAIGQPGDKGEGGRPQAIGPGNGRAYYFLWSLERMAVALGLETIGKKDWYGWGAEVLLASQGEGGGWHGEFGSSGADTCFALLFLRRANLVADLSARLGKVKDNFEAVLRGGGVGGDTLKGRKPLKSGLAPEDKEAIAASQRKAREGEKKRPALPAQADNPKAGRLSESLVEASGGERRQQLKKLRDTPGVDYTEALALAIPRLEGAARREARDALQDRFGRLTAKSLKNYLSDPDPEIRRAAVLASADKKLRAHVPALIQALDDPEPLVARAAHAALKALAGKDLGPPADATKEQHDKAVAAWKRWWREK